MNMLPSLQLSSHLEERNAVNWLVCICILKHLLGPTKLTLCKYHAVWHNFFVLQVQKKSHDEYRVIFLESFSTTKLK